MGKMWLVLGAILAMSAAQTITPANFTSATSNLEDNNGILLLLSEGTHMVPIAPILGLTSTARTGLTPQGLTGGIVSTNPYDELIATPQNIVAINCNPSTGYLDPASVFSQALLGNVTAILLYTQNADYCSMPGYTGPFDWVYTMKSVNATKKMLSVINNPPVTAGIAYANSLQVINGSAPGNGTQNGPPVPSGTITTAVAMIILYAVTGVITALFIVIIITGAVRAHRHPERYGPRQAGQRRQGRAKGLARAMLDSLPIVKFSGSEAPKPPDVELAERSVSPAESTEITTPAEHVGDGGAKEARAAATPAVAVEGGIAAAASPDRSAEVDQQGCSICTEDFEAGQDQRVLPCDHRFHPECVDPWLLNVSGTCPLCRIELDPNGSAGEEGEDAGEDGLANGSEPPPLGLQGGPGERHRLSVRRSIMMSLMGLGRPERATREERVLALRQLRGQRLLRRRREEEAAVAETPEEEQRARRTLRSFVRRRPTQPTTATLSPTTSNAAPASSGGPAQ